MANYMIADMNAIEPVACPCGWARRAFGADPNSAATLHVTDVSADARPHYHKTLTEIYVILEGEGHIELDGDRVAVKPLTAVYIKPGCRHRAVGPMRVLIAVIPPFDQEDEWFDQ